jgi:hypothetical protein
VEEFQTFRNLYKVRSNCGSGSKLAPLFLVQTGSGQTSPCIEFGVRDSFDKVKTPDNKSYGWVDTCSFPLQRRRYPEDGGSIFLRNVGRLPIFQTTRGHIAETIIFHRHRHRNSSLTSFPCCGLKCLKLNFHAPFTSSWPDTWP